MTMGRWGSTAVATALLIGCSSPAAGPAPSVTARTARPPGSANAAATHVVSSVADFHLPATLSRAVALAPAPGLLEVLGGLHDGRRTTNAVLDIDLASRRVQVAGRLPVAVHDAAGALLGGVPTLVGGGNSTDTPQIQQVKPSSPGPTRTSVVGQLPAPLSDAVGVSTSRGIVIVGGYDGAQASAQVLLVSAADSASRLATLPVPVRYPAVALSTSGAAERLVVFGGESRGVATDVVQQIDLASGHTAVIGHLPMARTQASALVLGGSIFVLGGATSGGADARMLADALRWDPTAGRFSAAGSLPYPVADAAAVVSADGHGYLVGGESPARRDTTIELQGR